MPRVIVNSGELYVAQAPCEIESVGIGSCVVICLYDKNRKIGGLLHSMLASSSENFQKVSIAFNKNTPITTGWEEKYVDTATDLLVKKLKEVGGAGLRLEAKVVGGSEMFKHISDPTKPSIGKKNIHAAREALAKHGIPIVSSDTGGTIGRSVKFSLDTGIVEIRKRLSSP